MKELVQTPMKKRESKSKKGMKRRGSQSQSSGFSSVQSEYIFCIMNEKHIFQALKDATAKKKDDNS